MSTDAAASTTQSGTVAPHYKTPASPVTSVINMVNAVIGAGVLGLPFAFAKAGLLPALLIFVLMLVLSYLSLKYLIYVSDATLVYSYGELAGRIYGPVGVVFVAFTTFLHCFGLLWAYVVLAVDFLTSFIRTLGAKEDPFSGWRTFLTGILGLIVFIPLSWFRRVDSISKVSSLAMLAIFYAIIVIFTRFITRLSDDSIEIDAPEVVHPSMSIVQCFSTLCFAFSCQQSGPIVQGELKLKSASVMHKVIIVALIMCSSIYLVAALCGYIQFTSEFFSAESGGNVLTLYSDDDIFALTARLGAMVVVICSYPALMIPARGAIFNAFTAISDIYHFYTSSSSSNRSLRSLYANIDRIPPFIPPHWKSQPGLLCWTKHHVATAIFGTAIAILTIVLSMAITKVAFVFDLIGSTASTLVCYIFPALFYIHVRHHPEIYVNHNRLLVLSDGALYRSGNSTDPTPSPAFPSSAAEPQTNFTTSSPQHSDRGRVVATEIDSDSSSDSESKEPSVSSLPSSSSSSAPSSDAEPQPVINPTQSAAPLLLASSPLPTSSSSSDSTSISFVQHPPTVKTSPDVISPISSPFRNIEEQNAEEAKQTQILQQLLHPLPLLSPRLIIALSVVILGFVFGLVSLAMAIIYDTNIAEKYNIS